MTLCLITSALNHHLQIRVMLITYLLQFNKESI